MQAFFNFFYLYLFRWGFAEKDALFFMRPDRIHTITHSHLEAAQ